MRTRAPTRPATSSAAFASATSGVANNADRLDGLDSQDLKDSAKLRCPGGTQLFVGVCMEPDEIEPGVAVSKELTIRGTFGAMPAEYGATLAAIGDGRIDAGSIITGTVGLDGVMGAFTELANPERHAKIVVVP